MKISLLLLIALTMSCNMKIEKNSVAEDTAPEAEEEVEVTEELSMEGIWLGDCWDLGGGIGLRVYEEIDANLDAKIVNLIYGAADCSGAYSKVDYNNDPVVTPAVNASFTDITSTITGAPADLKIYEIVTNGTYYNIAYLSEGRIDALTIATTDVAGTDWTTWRNNTQVAGFADDPLGYAGPGIVIRMTPVSGLP